MTNAIEIKNNQQPIEAQTTKSGQRLALPDLFWAAVIFAALNILLLIWFTVSPKLSLGASGLPKENRAAVADKPSPFTPVVDERRYARKQPEKVRPVVVAALENLEAGASWTSAQAQPVSMDSDRQAYVRGGDVYQLVERETDMPRMTAATFTRTNASDGRSLSTHGVSPQIVR
jgi:hypothetical protein